MRRFIAIAAALAASVVPVTAVLTAETIAPTAAHAAAPGCANQMNRQDNVSLLGDNATAPLFADRYFDNALQTTHGGISPKGNAKWVLCWTVQGTAPYTFGTVYLWNEGARQWAGDNPQYHHINTATAGIPSYSEGYLFLCHGDNGQFTLSNLSLLGQGESVDWSPSLGGVKFAEVNAQGTPDLFANESGSGLCDA